MSGMARGMTPLPLRSRWKLRGTVAVFGCGMDIVYPPENLELYKRIAEQGAVATNFRSGVAPTGRPFR